MEKFATHVPALGLALALTVLLVMGQGMEAQAQGGAEAQVDPEIQKKAESDLQALTGFLTTPAPMVMAAGASTQKVSMGGVAKAAEHPSWLQGKSKEEAMMEVLILKNQVFQGSEMPASRKHLNVVSFLSDLESVMSQEEFSRLVNNEVLLKELDLFVDETSENQ